MMDWSPDTKQTSPFRNIQCCVSAVFAGGRDFLEGLLLKRPDARIIHILSHEKRMGFTPVLEEDGSIHRDEFGMEVYIASEIDWFGHMTDIDERYEGTGLLPF